MGSRRDLSVDGSALAVAVRAEAESAAAEVPELRRRLERREADLKRKDREISLLQREIQKLSNESKKYIEENENLNRSLSNSRLLNHSMLDDSVHNQLKLQVAELQQALTASEKTTNTLRGEIEALRSTNRSLEAGLEDTVLANQTSQAGRSAAAVELHEVQTKVRFLQKTITEKEEQIQSLEASLAAAKESERRFKGMVEHQQIILAANEKAMSEQAEQLRDMRQALQVRNETNHILRTQVDTANEFTFALTKKELEYLRKIEGEHKGLQERNKDLVRSVELHMELIQRAETEAARLRSQLEESKLKIQEMAAKMSGKYTSEQDLATLRFLKKEVVRLRKENKEFQEGLDKANDDLRALQFSKGFKSSVDAASVPSSTAARAEVSAEQSRQVRIAAEETARALRNRMSFLLEQLEQASLLAASWQQQKAILKAEIGSLLRANHSLREKLISMQRNVLNTLGAKNEGGVDSFVSHRAFLTDTTEEKDLAQETSNRLMDDLVALEAASEAVIQSGGGQAAAMPDSVEANIERALFDTICAFSAGLRGEDAQQVSKANPKAKRKVLRSKGGYRLFTAADGRVDIVVEGGDVDAGELLMNLQLPAFLKFIQSRPSDKIVKLFTEKMIVVLNYVRDMIQDYLEQLGDARMQLGKLQSRASVSLERAAKVRERCSRERLSKQKAIMRYIREQLRISDIRLAMSEVSESASNYLDLYLQRERVGDATFREKGIKEILGEIVQVRKDLESIVNDSSDVPLPDPAVTPLAIGALELRLASCELDDETLHGVVGLVCGVLAPIVAAADPSTLAEQSNKTIGLAFDNKAETQVVVGAQLARSMLMAHSDYTLRLISMDLRRNLLTDVSCKVLGAMLEKSNCLRLLDLRENLISKAGAKLLFESTRRNITILYVTQRQSGFMIEGHREILGSAPMDADDHVEGAGADSMGQQYGDTGPRHSLRIDIRFNVSSDEAIEALLESVEFKSGVRYIPAAENTPQDAPITLQSILNDPKNFNEMLLQRGLDRTLHDKVAYSNISVARGSSAGIYDPNLRSRDVITSSSRKIDGSPGLMRKTGSMEVAVGNRIHARVSEAKSYQPEDEDDENILDLGLSDELQNMLLARKDKDNGIVGVGGLLEQQIRKLQIQQPHAALHSGRSGLSISEKFKSAAKNSGWTSGVLKNSPEEMTRIYQAPMRELASISKKNKVRSKISILKGLKRRPSNVPLEDRLGPKNQSEIATRSLKTASEMPNKVASSRPPLRPPTAVHAHASADFSMTSSGGGARSSSPATLNGRRPASAPSPQRQQTIRGFGSTAPAPVSSDPRRSVSPIHRLNLDPAILF